LTKTEKLFIETQKPKRKEKKNQNRIFSRKEKANNVPKLSAERYQIKIS